MHLTKKAIEAASPTGRLTWLPDTGPNAVDGLYLLVTPAGTKSFVCRYRLHGSRRRRTISLGLFGAITLEAARDKAKRINAQALNDHDPLANREARRGVLSFKGWVETYLTEAAKRKKPASLREDRRYTDIAVEAWGARSIDAVSQADVRNLHGKIGEKTPIQADRWLASIRKLFAVAVEQGRIPVNPATGVRPLTRYVPRHRVLSETEMASLSKAMKTLDLPTRTAILFMLGAGLRSSEARTVRWQDLNLKNRTLTLPATKSGKAQAVPLSAELVVLVQRMPRVKDSPYLFPGRDTQRPRADWKKPWKRVLEAAGLTDAGLTAHDLRRTAGYIATKASGIAVANRLLRHSSLNLTSAIYAPLVAEDARPAVVEIAKFVARRARKTA